MVDSTVVDIPTITMDEDNIIRYAARYIYPSNYGNIMKQIQLLVLLNVCLYYTKKWIWLLEGAFVVIDIAYTFLIEGSHFNRLFYS